MRTFIICLLFFLILVSPGIALAQESGDGTIEGQVINDTAEGGTVSGLQVRLFTYVDDNIQPAGTTITGEEGNFRFGELSRDDRYLLAVTYMEVDYYYPVVFSTGRTTEHVQVAVCDSTDNDRAIKIVMTHKIIDFTEDKVVVTEMSVLVNEGDRTYIGNEDYIVNEEQGILVFTLPEDVTGFKSTSELANDLLLFDDRHVIYVVPFPPGELQVVFIYEVPIPKSNELDLSFTFDYPTDYLDIMINGHNVEASTGQLAPAEPVETGTGERYIHYTGQAVSRGSVIRIHLSRLSGNSSLPFIITGVVILIVITIPVCYFARRRSITRRQQSNGSSVNDEK